MASLAEGVKGPWITRARQARQTATEAHDRLSRTMARSEAIGHAVNLDLVAPRVNELNQLIANLNKKLEGQPVIEEAKGILMARSHCSPDEAFEMLRRASMRMNRKLRQVAADIVQATTSS